VEIIFHCSWNENRRKTGNSRGVSYQVFTFYLPVANVKEYGLKGTRTEKMEQSAPAPTPSLGNRPARYSQFLLGSAIISLLIVAVYYQVLGRLISDWWRIPDFSHGFLVPPFAAFLVWEKRKALRNVKVTPNWGGIALMTLGLIVLVLGVYGSELFLSRVSLVIVMAGLVLCFGGIQYLKALRFPLLVLLLAIPLPEII
jgi:hypothetical protein